MSEKFSETRKFFWRDLEFIADYIKKGDRILDYGCGNGRLLEILNDKEVDPHTKKSHLGSSNNLSPSLCKKHFGVGVNYTGVDISGKLIVLAKQKYKGKNIKFQKISSQDSLPLSDNYFNVVISIAVFHHFPEEYAEKMAKELYRILKPEGKIIVTAWNLEQERFRKFIKKGSKDIIIPFKDNDGKIFNRYHRIYAKKDLGEIFSKAGFKAVKIRIVNGRNILLIGKK